MNDDIHATQDEFKGWHSRGYLTHLDAADLIQGVTFRLADSLPARVVDQWRRDSEEKGDSHLVSQKIAAWLDAGRGACHLGDDRIAQLVENSLFHSDGARYRLLAWVIMPNHAHVLIELLEGWHLPAIVQAWKSFTARQANKILGLTSTFWHADYFDRYIRDTSHLARTVAYIHENPVKAGLVEHPQDWPYSSANPKWNHPK